MTLGRRLAAAAGAWLLAGSADAAVWRVPGDFPTLQAAVDAPAVADGDTLLVLGGRRAGATLTKSLEIRGVGDATIVHGPEVGPAGRAGFLLPGGGAGSGATITALRFETVAFPVFSRGADDVSVTHNTLVSPKQGVTSWAGGAWGRGWDVLFNRILGVRAACGSGIGILIGDFAGGEVSGNLVAHNEVRGRVQVAADDCGGYGAPGIVLFADFRYAGDTGARVERNRVVKNRVQLVSTRPDLVPATGVELTDTRDLAAELVLRDNEVVYDDLRGMPIPLALTPAELATVNRIERNRTGPRIGRTNRALRSARDARPAPMPVR